MDQALHQAYRRAQAQPDDPAARQAYAQQLLRVGHTAAALHEFLALTPRGRLEDLNPFPDGLEVHLELLTVLSPLRGDPQRAVARPDSSDPRFPFAGIAKIGEHLFPAGPLLLFKVPSCETCLQPEGPEGAVACEACEGRGQIVEFTGRAEDVLPCDRCDELGVVPCHDCEGSTIPDFDPAARPGPCACGRPLETEYERVVWDPPGGEARVVELARCPGCGLGALRRRRRGAWIHACQACGWLACRCA